MMEWIKVSDQLPNYDINVLATDGEKCWVAERWKDQRGEFFNPASHLDFYNFNADPIFWMPLPELPTSE